MNSPILGCNEDGKHGCMHPKLHLERQNKGSLPSCSKKNKHLKDFLKHVVTFNSLLISVPLPIRWFFELTYNIYVHVYIILNIANQL